MKDEMKTNPSYDLISRADAIGAMEVRIKWFNGDAIEDRCKRDALIQALDKITELPSAEIPTDGDLISRRWLLDLYGDYIGDNGEPKYYVPLEVVRQNIIDAPSAEAVQGDGRNNIKRYPNCQIRTTLGNCDAIGGFCTSINAPICDAFQKLSKAVQVWIPFTRRPMTEDEQKDYPNCTFMFDCVLPDDGDEILVSNKRFVWMDTFCSDIDGCYLDSGDDIDEDMAWMPLPTPYKGGDTE